MAIYNVTTSGNLQFEDTGLGVPVSFFAYTGIAANALSANPIGGDNPVIYNIPPIPTFSSSGGIVFESVNLGTQSGLAASSIGEFPISGTVDNIPEVEYGLFTVTAAEESHGNLVTSGATVENRAWSPESSGNLIIPTSQCQSGLTLLESTSGNLLLINTDATEFVANTATSGNLLISTSDSYLWIANTSSAGSLVISGTDTVYRSWLKTSSGNLVTSGNIVDVITILPNSSGQLVITDWGYGNSLFTGGIAADPIAAQAIASGNIANVTTTQISFYGNISSSGNLIIDPVGELVTSLSSSSGIAGAALADIPIGGGMDTVYTATTYQDYYNRSTAGNLWITGHSAYGYTYTSAGNLVLIGNTEVSFSRNRSSAGNLLITGSTTSTSLQNELSSGNLVEVTVTQVPGSLSSASGIAGSALASLPIGGGQDSLQVNYPVILINESTVGNLVVSGTTVQSSTRRELSSGNLVIDTSDSYNSLRNELSAGLLKIYASDSGNSLRNETSSGNLRLFDADATRTIQIEQTHGNIVSTGNTVFNVAKDRVSNGNLILINTDTYEVLRNAASAGNLVIESTGQYTVPLSDSSGIAGAAIATIPVGGGMDNYPITTVFQDLWNESSSGNMVVSGNTVTVRTLDFLSSGNLDLSGTTVFNVAKGRPSAGNLVLVSSDSFSISWSPTSAGELVIQTTGQYVLPLSDSSGIAGAALASLPIGGGKDLVPITTKFSDLFNEDSSGELALSGSTVTVRTLDFLSQGQLVLSGTDSQSYDYVILSHGNLHISGSSSISYTLNKTSAGLLQFTPVGFTATSTESGGIAGASIAEVPYGGVMDDNSIAVLVSYISQGIFYDGLTAYTSSAGNLKISGTDTVEFVEGGTVVSHGNLVTSGSSTISTTQARTSAGALLVNGTTTLSLTSARSSSGQLLVSGSDTVVFISGQGQISHGNLVVSGTSTDSVTLNEDSAGNMVIVATDQVRRAWDRTTSGQLIITGTSTSEFIPANLNIHSNGVLDISGSTQVEFISRAPQRTGGGGSYVFPSSWDALRPYFPDDRHILGYQRAETNTGNLRVNGFAQITFISGTNRPPGKMEFLRSLRAAQPRPAPIPQVVKPAAAEINPWKSLALAEDQMLLDGSLTDFDFLEHELEQELL